MNTGRSTVDQVAESIEYEEKLPREIQKHVLTFFNERELRNTALVNRNFNQLSHETITELRRQYIVAYRYKVTIATDMDEVLRGGHTITEFFIPSLDLCFNENVFIHLTNLTIT